MTPLTAASLFAGIGGLDLALDRAGVRVTAAVEIDPDCRGVLARHFPRTRLFNDVTEVTGDQLRATGFVPGHGIAGAGWPCQGNSAAGRRRGLADPRTGLWRHVVRILAETRPRWFIGENVPGLLSINDGRDFGTILRDLDELGYGVAWRVLDAQRFGVPQQRRRVILAAGLGDPAGPVQVLFEPESSPGNPAAGRTPAADPAGIPADHAGNAGVVGTLGTTGPGGGWRLGSDEAATGQLVVSTLQGGGRRGHRIDAEGAAGGHLIRVGAPAVTNTLTTRNNRNNREDREDREDTYITAPDGTAVRRLTPLEYERLQGFPDHWTQWDTDGRENSDSVRYRLCGNAIAVPVAQWLANRVVAYEARAATAADRPARHVTPARDTGGEVAA